MQDARCKMQIERKVEKEKKWQRRKKRKARACQQLMLHLSVIVIANLVDRDVYGVIRWIMMLFPNPR
jgi:hypothetical protein